MRFSRRTLASLARTIEHVYSHSSIDALSYEFGVAKEAIGSNKLSRAVNMVAAMEEICAVQEDDQEFVDISYKVLQDAGEYRREESEIVRGFLALLSIDGFTFGAENLIPTTPEPAQLGTQISLIEQSLESSNLPVALRHYQQATENMSRGSFEAANGQLRSFLEDLFIAVGERMSERKFSDPSAALQNMRDIKAIDNAEWNMCRSIWRIAQSNGPHHGLTTEEEALFRLHTATAVARYLLKKLSI